MLQTRHITTLIASIFIAGGLLANPQEHGHDNHDLDAQTHENHATSHDEIHHSESEDHFDHVAAHEAEHESAHGAAHDAEHESEGGFDAVNMIMHHIADAHDWHLIDLPGEDGHSHPVSIPLPVIIYSDGALDVFMSSAFDHGHAIVSKGDRNYALHHGKIERVDAAGHTIEAELMDFSITKNVAAMWISILLLLWLFGSAAKSYRRGKGAPTGKAKFLEPLVLFVRDDIARPNIGEKHEKFLPFLLTVFFFIWINNLFGLIPVLAPNLTGNISVTLVLAAMTLIITNVNGNKAYWGHIIKPPVPIALYPIMIPVEIIGIFTKAFALMIRLFANITAGHILILSLVSLIFIFESMAMSALSIPFMVFMNTLELLVAALQAYIFTLLSALFIGMAVEEHH